LCKQNGRIFNYKIIFIIALKNCLERRAFIYTRRENQAGECGLGLPPHPLRPHQKAFRCPQGGLGQAGGQCACTAYSIFLEEIKRPGANAYTVVGRKSPK
jgi:hypothetical protein